MKIPNELSVEVPRAYDEVVARVREGRESDARCWGVSRADLPALAGLARP